MPFIFHYISSKNGMKELHIDSRQSETPSTERNWFSSSHFSKVLDFILIRILSIILWRSINNYIIRLEHICGTFTSLSWESIGMYIRESWLRIPRETRFTLQTKKPWGHFDASDFASHFLINLEEKVSEAADEGKMLNLRWSCSRMEVDTRYKVASDGAWIWSNANNHIQVCMLQCHFLRTHRLCYTILTSDLLAQFGSASERKSKGQGFESHVELAKSQTRKTLVQHWICITLNSASRTLINL